MDTLILSENWRARGDGITLIADDGIENLEMAKKLMNILPNEENPYVKGRILHYLKQSEKLKGDIEVLSQLDAVLNNETNALTLVDALKAKMQLSEQPYHILPDAIQALHTVEPELQIAGLIAIDKILEREEEYLESGAYMDRNTIKNDIQSIRNLSAYGDDKMRLEPVIKHANSIYLRHFEN